MLTTYHQYKWKWEIDPQKKLTPGNYFIVCMHDGKPTPQKVNGYLVTEGGRKFIIHRVPNRAMWAVSDYETGLQIVSNITREKAAREFDFKNDDGKLVDAIKVQSKNYSDLAAMISNAYSELSELKIKKQLEGRL